MISNRLEMTTQREHGFGLVELMVAVVIGIIASLAILQTLVAFEGQKARTTSGADAQTNGAVALYSIVRDLQMSGFGLIPTADNSPLECAAQPVIDGISLTPVIAQDGADGPIGDQIQIRYGLSRGTQITPTAGASFTAGVATRIVDGGTAGATSMVTVDNHFGCARRDVVLSVIGNNCQMTRVTDDAALSVSQIPPLAAAFQLQLVSAPGAGFNNGSLACIGDWRQVVYTVTATGDLALNGTPIVSGIYSIQMQYGIAATAASNQVACWANPGAADCGGGWNNIDALAAAQRNRIKAVKIAVIARSQQRENAAVTAGNIRVFASGPNANPVDVGIAGDNQNFRYRSFETVVPLRNTVWAWDTL